MRRIGVLMGVGDAEGQLRALILRRALHQVGAQPLARPRRDALDCVAHQVRTQSLDHLPLSRVADQPCKFVNGEPQ